MATRFTQVTQGPAHKWWVLAAVQSGTLMAVVDTSIVSIALPTILQEFAVDIETVKWVATAYLCTITISLLTVGRLADLFGRKRMIVAGFVIFTASSALCGAALALNLLIGFRVLQALGATFLLANALAIMTAVFPAEERGRALGIQASVVAIGQMIGPALGGLLLHVFGWRAIFLINLPIGLLGVVLAAAVLREERISGPRGSPEPFDLAGAVLSSLAVGIIFLAAERLADEVADATTWALLLVGLALLALFVAVERRVAHPLVDPRLFKQRAFSFGAAAIPCAFVAAAASAFLMPFYLQLVLGFSPLAAGLLLTPTAIGIIVGGPAAGWLSSRLGSRPLTTAGLACCGLAMLWLSTLGVDSHYSEVLPPLILLGLGLGLFQPPNNAAVLGAAPRERLGVASALLSTMRILGQFIGMSLGAEIIGNSLAGLGGLEAVSAAQDLAARQPLERAYVEGQSLAFRLAAGLVLIGVVLSAWRGADGRKPAPSVPAGSLGAAPE